MENLMYHTILQKTCGVVTKDEVRECTKDEFWTASMQYDEGECKCRIVHDIPKFSFNERRCAFCGKIIRYVDVGRIDERHPKMFKRTHGGI